MSQPLLKLDHATIRFGGLTAVSKFNLEVQPCELIGLIGELTGDRLDATFDDWRPADQRYYVSDVSKFRDATGWSPQVSVREGVGRLHDWLLSTRTSAAPVVAGKVAS